MDDAELDRLLHRARLSPPAARDDFMTRLQAEALAALPAAHVPQATPVPAAQRAGGWLRHLWQGGGILGGGAFGGGVLASMGGVAMLGLWVGYADPAGLAERLTAQPEAGFETGPEAGVEFAPAAEFFLTEG